MEFVTQPLAAVLCSWKRLMSGSPCNVSASTSERRPIAIPKTNVGDEHVRISAGLSLTYSTASITWKRLVRRWFGCIFPVNTGSRRDFNWYAEIWTDAIMADLQNRILRVIKARCEREAARDWTDRDNSAPSSPC